MAPKSAKRRIVVDGSNIATEGRSAPSLAQLDEAIRSFLLEHPGFGAADVTVVVDATFGHRIDRSERLAFDQAIEHGEMVTPPAGAIGRGDGFILRIAEKSGALVLSNDSFQEFQAERPWLFEPGRLIGGKPVPGVGWVFTPRTPVRGPRSRVSAVRSRRSESEEAAPSTAPANRGRSRPARAQQAATADQPKPAVGSKKSGAAKSDHSKPQKAAKAAKPAKVVEAAKPAKPPRTAESAGAIKVAKVAKVAKPAKAKKSTKTSKAVKAVVKAVKAAVKPTKATKATKPAKTVQVVKATKAAKPTGAAGAVASDGAVKGAKKAKAAVGSKKSGAAKAASREAGDARAGKKAAQPGATAKAGAKKAAQGASGAKAAKAVKTAKGAKATKADKGAKASKDGAPAKAAASARSGGKAGSSGRGGVGGDGATAAGSTALNDPMTFLTFVADHPVGTTLEGTVVSFTSHGAHIAVGDMVCHVPLRGLGRPAPSRARQVLAKGETRRFVLVSLDATHRRAELALPGLAR